MSSTDHGVGHAYCTSPRRTGARSSPSCSSYSSARSSRAPPAPPVPRPTTPAGGCDRSTDRWCEPFDAPSSDYAAGHRGVDFAAAPGTPVRAANDGVVSFAGSVAGTLHVTIAHAGDLRTSYSFLSSVGGARSGNRWPGATWSASPVASAPTTTAACSTSVCASATGTSTRCCCSAPPTSPRSCAWCPRAPLPRPRGRRPASGARCSRRCTCRRPVATSTVARPRPTTRCDTGVPLVGDAIDAACDLGTWLGDGADAAVDAGLRFLDATTGLGSDGAWRACARRWRRPCPPCARCRRSWRAPWPGPRPDMLALDVVAIGRRFADTVTADCSDDASRCRRHRRVRAPRDGRRRDRQRRERRGTADRRSRST